MRWIVGLDLLDHSHGALRFARWLHQRGPGEVMIGVHALGMATLHDPEIAAETPFKTWILEATRRSVAELGAAEAFAEIGVIEAMAPEDGLERALVDKGASALILGRRARSRDDRLVRLGRVARRLLRQMPAPIAVVPPDLADEPPPGPVVVATDLDASAESALAFAALFAALVGRELVVVHAVAPEGAMRAYVSATAWDRANLEAIERGAARVRSYLDARGVTARAEVVPTPIAAGVLDVCAREGACALVCGSRRLSFVDRIFTSSVGSELAALATIPVIVVPPETGPA